MNANQLINGSGLQGSQGNFTQALATLWFPAFQHGNPQAPPHILVGLAQPPPAPCAPRKRHPAGLQTDGIGSPTAFTSNLLGIARFLNDQEITADGEGNALAEGPLLLADPDLEELGDEDVSKREEATRRLKARLATQPTEELIAGLLEAVQDRDPEVAARARDILCGHCHTIFKAAFVAGFPNHAAVPGVTEMLRSSVHCLLALKCHPTWENSLMVILAGLPSPPGIGPWGAQQVLAEAWDLMYDLWDWIEPEGTLPGGTTIHEGNRDEIDRRLRGEK